MPFTDPALQALADYFSGVDLEHNPYPPGSKKASDWRFEMQRYIEMEEKREAEIKASPCASAH